MDMHVCHVYACICMYVAASILDHWPNCLQVRICTYMYVFHCICMYMSHMHICVFVYACIAWNDTLRHGNRCHVPETQSLGAAIGGPHSGHDRASEHSLFFALGNCWADPIRRTPPRDARPGPLKRPSRSAWRSPIHDPRTTNKSRCPSQQIWLVGIHPAARGRRPPPLGNTSRP